MQVAFSRAESRKAFAVADNIPLDMEMYLKIGQGKAYEARREFIQRIRLSAEKKQSDIW